jgi:hypothetical protein
MHLLGVETEHPGRRDRCRGGCEGGVVPADLAHARKRDLAETLLELVGECDSDQEVAPRAAGALGRRHGCGDEVRGV